jgi:farnesyl diphosphate synthase
MDSSLTRRGHICWYQKPGIGLDAINDALLLEASIYLLLKFYCREQPYLLPEPAEALSVEFLSD